MIPFRYYIHREINIYFQLYTVSHVGFQSHTFPVCTKVCWFSRKNLEREYHTTSKSKGKREGGRKEERMEKRKRN